MYAIVSVWSWARLMSSVRCRAGLPIPAFNPYPHHIPASACSTLVLTSVTHVYTFSAAMPTMLAPASYHMAPMST